MKSVAVVKIVCMARTVRALSTVIKIIKVKQFCASSGIQRC